MKKWLLLLPMMFFTLSSCGSKPKKVVYNIGIDPAWFSVDLLEKQVAVFGFCTELLEDLSFHEDPLDAAQGADALLIMTEWKSFRSPDFHTLKQALAAPVIFDGRNIYDTKELNQIGFEHYGIGIK